MFLSSEYGFHLYVGQPFHKNNSLSYFKHELRQQLCIKLSIFLNKSELRLYGKIENIKFLLLNLL